MSEDWPASLGDRRPFEGEVRPIAAAYSAGSSSIDNRLVCLRKFEMPPKPARGLADPPPPEDPETAKAGMGGLGLSPVPNPITLPLNALSCSSTSFFLKTVEFPIPPPNREFPNPLRSGFSSKNLRKSLISPASCGGFPSLMNRFSSSCGANVLDPAVDRGILVLPAPNDNLEEALRTSGSPPPPSPLPEDPRP